MTIVGTPSNFVYKWSTGFSIAMLLRKWKTPNMGWSVSERFGAWVKCMAIFPKCSFVCMDGYYQ